MAAFFLTGLVDDSVDNEDSVSEEFHTPQKGPGAQLPVDSPQSQANQKGKKSSNRKPRGKDKTLRARRGTGESFAGRHSPKHGVKARLFHSIKDTYWLLRSEFPDKQLQQADFWKLVQDLVRKEKEFLLANPKAGPASDPEDIVARAGAMTRQRLSSI
ncbi:unnamed protein product [Symbiodinium sp. CCMP2592]|nr:unnamed protein product [Symbiodinium sp. CCMP2592]CAE7221770.1 unnamed protein product [Symbiodinium sp. CCMP2592]